MRSWLSFPTGIRRIRLGASVNLNTTARIHYVSATGMKIWRVGSALMLIGLEVMRCPHRRREGPAPAALAGRRRRARR